MRWLLLAGLLALGSLPALACTDPTLPPYNADKTGRTDSTAAIQAAVNATAPGEVCLPGGNFKTSAPITNPGNVTVSGAGDNATVFFPTHNGDVFLVTAPNEANVFGAAFRNFRIYRTDNPTAGAGLHYINAHLGTAENVRITGPFIGVWCESCVTSSFANVNVVGDNTTPSSVGYMFSRAANGINNSEVFVTSADVRAQNAPNLGYAIYVSNADGIWFSGHFGFSSVASMALIPQSPTDQLTGIHCSSCEFDTSTYGLYVGGAGGHTAPFGNVQLGASAAILMSSYGVFIDPSATNFKGLLAPGFLFNQNHGGTVYQGAGTGISFPNSLTE